MKLLASKKALLSILGVSSIVIASTYRDIKSHTAYSEKIVDEKEEMVALERNVASEEGPSRVVKLDLPVNAENIKKINGSWEVTRVIGSDEQVKFDKFQSQEDSKRHILVDMKLIANGAVRLDERSDNDYLVSILTNFGTIAIYKRLGNGFEIIELKKTQVKTEVVDGKFEAVSEETDLVLERALNQAKGNQILMGDSVSGQMTLKGNNMSNVSISLHNQNGEDQSIEIDTADLMDGGAFKTEVNGEEVSGVLFNNGKDGYRLSFVTGPLAGAMLNFVTKDQFDVIQEKEEAIKRDQVEQSSVNEEKAQEVQEAQAQKVEERKVDMQALPESDKLTVEEIKETAAQNGFSF